MFGIGDDSRRIELEGVEDEGPAQQVVTDHHPPPTQAGLGNEGVGRSEVAGGHLVGREPWLSFPHLG